MTFVDWFFWISIALFVWQAIRFFREPSEAEHQIQLRMMQAERKMEREMRLGIDGESTPPPPKEWK